MQTAICFVAHVLPCLAQWSPAASKSCICCGQATQMSPAHPLFSTASCICAVHLSYCSHLMNVKDPPGLNSLNSVFIEDMDQQQHVTLSHLSAKSVLKMVSSGLAKPHRWTRPHSQLLISCRTTYSRAGSMWKVQPPASSAWPAAIPQLLRQLLAMSSVSRASGRILQAV